MKIPSFIRKPVKKACPPQNEFTIGWICVLENEYFASRAVLDEQYDNTAIVCGLEDENLYTLGRIGNHRLVINCPSAGDMGQVRASKIASDMKSTFPSIRFVLLVGIGGGVPWKHDIHLGDVVIGTRVVPYAFGKTTDDGFRRTSQVLFPPRFLLSAVTNLGFHITRGGELHGLIDQVASKRGCHNNRFGRPNTDRLYDRDYLHHEDCDCMKPQPEFQVTRTKTGDGSVVRIHQGAIGTADLVMKNAIERDKIAAHEDLVCFEMEAAGVMAITKCLPIRGISDYADGHKNDDWQSYAALAAATYAKELLLSMSVQSVSESKIEVAQWALERYVHGAVSKVNTDYPSSVNELQTAQSTHLALVDRYNLVHKLINTRPQKLHNVGAAQTQSIPTAQEIAKLRTLRDQLLLSVTTLQKQVNEKAEQNRTHNSRADWEGLKKQVNEDAVQMAEMSRITKNTMHTTSSFLQEFGRETGIAALRRAGIIMKHATEYTSHLEDFLKTHPFSLFGQSKNSRAEISSDGGIPLGQRPTMVEPYRPGLNDGHYINTSSANPLSTQVISIRPRMRLPFLRWLC